MTSIYLVGHINDDTQTCSECLFTVHIRNNNQSFCHRLPLEKLLLLKLTSLPWSSKQWHYEGLILSGMAHRNQEIDEHLSMTPINQKDKSSVSLFAVCYSVGDRHSPCMQTMSPVCQRHNNSAGRPHLHHCVNNKCDWSQYWLLYFGEKRCPQTAAEVVRSLKLSSLTFLKISKISLSKNE